jgi:nitrogen fixation/metabolism regulation signal transduction histidine kinase
LLSVLSNEDGAVFGRLLRRARRAGRSAEQSQLTRGGAATPIPVALTATALRQNSSDGRGAVVVIEDLSELLTAQRAAAWSEVARRVAHEIKNPLTPIQLSAERIARNFGVANGSQPDGVPTGPEEQSNGHHPAENRDELRRVVEECTTSITREVAGLKALVDEFARFARMPPPRLEPADLNDVIRQTAQLYEERLGGVELQLQLEPQMPLAMLDVEQMKRVCVNLIDNAIEALSDIHDDRRVIIRSTHDRTRDVLVAAVEDSGQGIAAADFKRLFQPYFSTRGRGTGLGLAIVARIIAEHDGKVYAEANIPRGARLVIELPVISG